MPSLFARLPAEQQNSLVRRFLCISGAVGPLLPPVFFSPDMRVDVQSTSITHRCIVMEEACTEANNYGDCHVSDIRPSGDDQAPPLTACVSRISEFRARAAAGTPAART